MITVKKATELVLGNTQEFGSETVNVLAATGRILAEDICADRDVPPFDRVTMDGFAIKHDDYVSNNRTFVCQATQPAGHRPQSLLPQHCIRVTTGAVLPHNADTIIPVEDTTENEQAVTINPDAVVRAGQFVHTQATDAKKGQLLVSAGYVCSSTTLPVIATAGQSTITVSRLPRTVIVATGDELVGAEDKPKPYQIRRSNDIAVQSFLSAIGIKADIRYVTDNSELLKQTLSNCLATYELIIISGGVSMGAYDYVPHVLKSLSVTIHLHRVAQKPGKPLLFGTADGGQTIFACPGNPVSLMLCLHRYIAPWLRVCLGAGQPQPRRAQLASDLKLPPGLTYFCPVTTNVDEQGTLLATPLPNNGSGDLISLIPADAFLEIPPNGRQLAKSGSVFELVDLRPIL